MRAKTKARTKAQNVNAQKMHKKCTKTQIRLEIRAVFIMNHTNR